MTADERQREAEELCAGEMRVVRGDGAFGHFGQSRDLVSGVRREGQYLSDATGRAVPEMRRRRATRRITFMPVLLWHGLVAGGLQLTNKAINEQGMRANVRTSGRKR